VFVDRSGSTCEQLHGDDAISIEDSQDNIDKFFINYYRINYHKQWQGNNTDKARQRANTIQ
jgi:hypothetical protein